MYIIILLITFVVIFVSLWMVNQNYNYVYPPAQKPPAQNPSAQKPPAQKPSAQKPSAQKPPTQKPPTRKPPAQKPPTQKPPTQKPKNCPSGQIRNSQGKCVNSGGSNTCPGGGVRNSQGKCPSLASLGRDSVTTTTTAPTKELLAKALAAYTKNNKSGIVNKDSVYKDLVERGYLQFKDGKWKPNNKPVGQPAVGSGAQRPSVPPSGGGSNKNPKNPKEVYAANPPNADKIDNVTIGGFTTQALLQWNDGDLQVSQNGTSISSSIDPQSTDGSNEGNSKKRHRNEIALVVPKKEVRDLETISFDFRANGTDNIVQHSTGVFFQLKPSGKGGGNAYRLGIRDGQLAIGLPYGTAQIVKDSSGKPIDMDKSHKFDVKFDGKGGGTVYVDGKPVKPPIKMANTETNIKFGLEGLPGTIEGSVSGQYDNIDINTF